MCSRVRVCVCVEMPGIFALCIKQLSLKPLSMPLKPLTDRAIKADITVSEAKPAITSMHECVCVCVLAFALPSNKRPDSSY